MTNGYGETLDSNGYAKSIIQQNHEHCYVCGKGGELARHEIFYGISYRRRSKELGTWISVCPNCHRQIHGDRQLDKDLKGIAQENAMQRYGWDTAGFRKRFGKNWI